ncbi:hypothetical protein M2M59_15060 [Rummeliibacillus sp. G93]|uniref:DUF6612 family protein n=1 Tax=Rummeliibacillus TaxID=648802 RepID=UPI00116A8747|nr:MULTISPECIES: DUF6612 family protein [Rummeliibacillus]MBB5171389.1 hypothetical protein [Rummeliibacillus stabekisii]UQW97215.1 hypothetical protein M2M59_15060 [Rummeliibacillus sp. G93]GEL06405.1 hypothetical protein RST01_30320 [Rummeliibacillus stabekisii]
MLKKILSLTMGLLLVFMLGACNSKAEPVNKQNGSTAKADSGLTLEQVFKKSTEASKNLKSYRTKMEVIQNINSGQNNVETDTGIIMDVVQNPMSFYQKLMMKAPESDKMIQTKSYFTKDGMFTYDPNSKKWMKFPAEMADQLAQASNQQTDPMAEIKQLKKFVKDFKFKQNDKNYILLLNASGEKFTHFIQEKVQKTLPAGMANSAELLKDMKINKVDYEIHIDKKTFYPTMLNLNMDMSLNAQGQPVKIKQEIMSKYEKYNQIKEIVVPEKVKKKAVEINS